MAQEIRTRKVGTVAFSVNNKVSESLPRGMVYRELHLHLKSAPTLTGVNNLSANVQVGDDWGVIKRIDIRANGTDIIKSFSANMLRWFNLFQYGVPPRAIPILGDGSTANPALSSVLILPLWIPNSVRPMDTALDARVLSSLEVEITWGTFTDINSAASAWTTEPVLDIYSLESFNVDGPFSSWRLFAIEKEITANNPRFEIELPLGNLYRSFFMNFTDAGVDDGDVLNNFKLVSGTNVFADQSEEVLDSVLPMRRGLARGFTGAAFDDYFVSDDSNFDGWYLYDLVTDGQLNEGIDTLGFSEFKLELDVTKGGGVTKAFIFPSEIVPVRAAANNA